MTDERRKKRRKARKIKAKIRSHMNIGTILFFLMVVYLLVNLISMLGKSKLAYYEVSRSEISDTIKGTGVILREEKVITSTEEGYINSYLSDGGRVKANGIVYTLDKTGQIQEEINQILEKNKKTTKEEEGRIREDLRNFADGYRDADFYMVSETQNKIQHDLLSYTGSLLSQNKKALEKKYGKGCYIEVKSSETGLVSYSSDGLENLTRENVRKSIFDRKVHMEDLQSKEISKPGSKVYRLVTSQKWNLIVPLSEEDYNRMKNLYEKGETSIPIKVDKDGFEITVPFECYEEKGQGYLDLQFSDYVQRYLNQRYLSIGILLVQGKGLKIPASSLVEKQAFRIPKDYLTEGGNTEKKDHVNVIYRNRKGEQRSKQISVKILKNKKDEDTVTIFSSELKEGDRIRKINEASTFPLSKSVTVYGCYTINSGYAVFSYVEITERNEDYCIFNSDTSEVQLYDRIILNSNSIHENDIIY